MKDRILGHILVVDDAENWRAFSKCILEDDGHQVLAVSTYSEASAALKENNFDVVILDMRLVDEQAYNVQGMILLDTLKRQSPFAGAVILTGYPSSIHRDRALNQYGADAYLEKVPVDADFDIEAFSKLVSDLVKASRCKSCQE